MNTDKEFPNDIDKIALLVIMILFFFAILNFNR